MKTASMDSTKYLAILTFILCSADLILAEHFNLCPRGNVTLISNVNHQILVTPDRCHPTPFVDRNQLNSKPKVQLMNALTNLPFVYTVLMVEENKHLDKYDIHWLEPNLTLNYYQTLMPNTSFVRDIRKMIEYRPPKSASYNATYLVLVYRQSTHQSVVPPSYPFRPNRWAFESSLTLIGGVQFLINATNNNNISPAHHYPMPMPLPIPVGGGSSGSGTGNIPHIPPNTQLPNNNSYLMYNNTYHHGYNYTNHTNYPRPPSGGYIPPSYHPVYPNNNGHYNNHHYKGKKGAAADLKATISLLTFIVIIPFIMCN